MGQTATTATRDGGPAGPADGPVVGIVVPLFKHSVLVADALASVIDQITTLRYVIVVVNDGCPFHDSDLQARAIRAVHPELITYLTRPNGGLSAARNTGIDFILAKFPSVQAIYFLDADNRLRPRAIETAYARLVEEEDASWVYPNIDMFGLRRNFDYSGPYSLLKHLFYNICEAGSLVHRRVFDAGIRFDCSMRHGYEDWEFWLSAAASGFRGVHHPHFGLLYRNRAESMLSQSKREEDAILAYVRRKHAALLHRDRLLSLQDSEAPRHALVFLDTGEVLLGLGGQGALSRAAFDALLWRNIVIPATQHIPPFFLFMTRALFDELAQAGVMAWVVHDSEIALATHNIACLEIESAAGSFFAVRAGREPRHCGVLAIKRDLLVATIMASDTAWIERLPSPDAEMRIVTKTLTLPRRPGAAAGATGTAAFGFLFRVMGWREAPFREAAQRSWIWRERSVPPSHDLFLDVRRNLDGDVIYPRPRQAGKSIGFVLSAGGFSGVERVACNVAQQFAAAGWSVHLFMLGTDRVERPEEFAGTFASINFLHDAMFGGWDGNSLYQGTALPAVGNTPGGISRIVAALGWLDVVINHHSGDLNGAAAALRRLGVVTATHLHLLDHTRFGRPVGHPVLALAYEHAYDLVLCDSNRLLAWMHAAGVPGDKLILVPNAPGHPVGRATRRDVLARRASPRHERLRVLYLGRLDRQKGIGRLADVIAQTRRLDLEIDWRIVGSVVIDAPSPPPLVQDLVEAPVYRAEQLTALFAWADVMLLLSDFEGVPLSVLEAQRLGVVVIATDVGAVAEIIESGVNGLLVRRETAVGDTVDLLRTLIDFPAIRSAIARAAGAVKEWPQTCAALLQRLDALRSASRKRRESAE
jgi:glycosyltransferase involved in cell wall biosynthesis